ncbi:MAG: winged helix-turn-helix domain-containing protein, partial [Dehalococcoidia bacterium]|nr:winged helix-turn-helix domain-containing protein [Dehalococcoidia bacterium]
EYPSVIQESEEELRALERKHRSNGRVAKRVQMVRLLKSGACRSMRHAAPVLEYSVPQLERWWRSYREGGIDALLVDSSSMRGRPELMTPQAWEGLNAEMEAGRMRTLEQVRRYLAQEWDVHYASSASVSGLFRRHKVKWKTGRRRHRKADAAAQAAFKQTSQPA